MLFYEICMYSVFSVFTKNLWGRPNIAPFYRWESIDTKKVHDIFPRVYAQYTLRTGWNSGTLILDVCAIVVKNFFFHDKEVKCAHAHRLHPLFSLPLFNKRNREVYPLEWGCAPSLWCEVCLWLSHWGSLWGPRAWALFGLCVGNLMLPRDRSPPGWTVRLWQFRVIFFPSVWCSETLGSSCDKWLAHFLLFWFKFSDDYRAEK